MRELADLYIEVIKHIRVVRNVSNQHKKFCGRDHIVKDEMTPYERGRMTRSSQKIGSTLTELCRDHGQHKVVVFLAAYVDGLGINPGAFAKPGSIDWNSLQILMEDMIDKNEISLLSVPVVFSHITAMIDLPLSKVQSRIALMRLSI